MRRIISAGVRRSPARLPKLAAGLACDDDSRGDVVLVLAEQDGGLQAVGRDERLLAAGTSQVAKPAGKRARIDGPERICRDANVILIVKLAASRA